MDQLSEHGQSLPLGKYLLVNNLWGRGGGAGSQHVRGTAPADRDKPIAWGTEWEWTGPENTVKSYASVILGWHWGWTEQSGLPIELSKLASLRSRWDFRLTEKTTGLLNVAYDIWIADKADPTQDDITHEIMIWLHRGGAATPIGKPVRTAQIEGAGWELWEGPHPARQWQVHSFVRIPSADSSDVDLAAFIRDLPDSIAPTDFLVGIEAGTEIFTGAGTLETTAYSVEPKGR